MLVTAVRLFPTRVATWSWVYPNSSIELLIGRRLLQDVEVLAMQVLDQGLLETLGLVGGLHQDRDGLETGPPGRPPPPLTGDELEVVRRIADPICLTSTGWSTPSSLIDAASEDMVSSSKLTRGWRGLGLMLPMGTSRRADDRSPDHLGGDEGAQALAQSATTCHR